MEEGKWRPLGVQTPEQVAEYDALHEGVPEWMEQGLWKWVRERVGIESTDDPRTWYVFQEDSLWHEEKCRRMCAQLRIQLTNVNPHSYPSDNIDGTINCLKNAECPLDIVDYLLAHDETAPEKDLQELLDQCGSAWTVGERNGFRGLVRRVPEGVQTAADQVMAESDRAGVRLAKAWEELYGLDPDPSRAYAEAIKAVEAAAIPVVCPNGEKATLGGVINVVRTQKWQLLMQRGPEFTTTHEVLLGMLRVLWNGQHDRHDNGEPNSPVSVNMQEATVAVGLAVTLVQWFHAGVVVNPKKST